IFSIAFASAGWFGNFFNKITGKVASSTNDQNSKDAPNLNLDNDIEDKNFDNDLSGDSNFDFDNEEENSINDVRKDNPILNGINENLNENGDSNLIENEIYFDENLKNPNNFEGNFFDLSNSFSISKEVLTKKRFFKKFLGLLNSKSVGENVTFNISFDNLPFIPGVIGITLYDVKSDTTVFLGYIYSFQDEIVISGPEILLNEAGVYLESSNIEFYFSLTEFIGEKGPNFEDNFYVEKFDEKGYSTEIDSNSKNSENSYLLHRAFYVIGLKNPNFVQSGKYFEFEVLGGNMNGVDVDYPSQFEGFGSSTFSYFIGSISSGFYNPCDPFGNLSFGKCEEVLFDLYFGYEDVYSPEKYGVWLEQVLFGYIEGKKSQILLTSNIFELGANMSEILFFEDFESREVEFLDSFDPSCFKIFSSVYAEFDASTLPLNLNLFYNQDENGIKSYYFYWFPFSISSFFDDSPFCSFLMTSDFSKSNDKKDFLFDKPVPKIVKDKEFIEGTLFHTNPSLIGSPYYDFSSCEKTTSSCPGMAFIKKPDESEVYSSQGGFPWKIGLYLDPSGTCFLDSGAFTEDYTNLIIMEDGFYKVRWLYEGISLGSAILEENFEVNNCKFV
ncbi:MAG: hypothetical protein KC516_03915, partial [Nanoarchaeota archaeon]|nr:hypothetical protein [Nanoarchaeota archaeon]